MFLNENLFEQANAKKALAEDSNAAAISTDWYVFDGKAMKVALLLWLEGKAGVNKNTLIFKKRKGAAGDTNPHTPKQDVYYSWGDQAAQKKRVTATGSSVAMFDDTGVNSVLCMVDIRPEEIGIDKFDQVQVTISAAGTARKAIGFWVEYTKSNPQAS